LSYGRKYFTYNILIIIYTATYQPVFDTDMQYFDTPFCGHLIHVFHASHHTVSFVTGDHYRHSTCPSQSFSTAAISTGRHRLALRMQGQARVMAIHRFLRAGHGKRACGHALPEACRNLMIDPCDTPVHIAA